MRQCAKFGANGSTVKPFRRYRHFSIFLRRRPSAILDFKKFEILSAGTVRRANMRHHAKLCANRLNRTDPKIWPFLIFQDSGRPPRDDGGPWMTLPP